MITGVDALLRGAFQGRHQVVTGVDAAELVPLSMLLLAKLSGSAPVRTRGWWVVLPNNARVVLRVPEQGLPADLPELTAGTCVDYWCLSFNGSELVRDEIRCVGEVGEEWNEF